MEPHATTPAATARRRPADHRETSPDRWRSAVRRCQCTQRDGCNGRGDQQDPSVAEIHLGDLGSMLAMIAPVAINNTPSKPHSSGSSSGVKSMTIMCASLRLLNCKESKRCARRHLGTAR
jgi:hypothetical protein